MGTSKSRFICSKHRPMRDKLNMLKKDGKLPNIFLFRVARTSPLSILKGMGRSPEMGYYDLSKKR